MTKSVLKTKICDMIGMEYPVFCAGMGSIYFGMKSVTGSKLAAAVSEAGGIGVIGAAMMTLDEMRQAIREVKEITKKPFGVDLLLPSGVEENAGDLSGLKNISIKELQEYLPKEQRDFVDSLMKELNLKDISFEPNLNMTLMRPRDAVDICLEEKVPVFAAGLGNPAFMVDEAHAQGMVVMGLVGNVKNAKRVAASGVDIIIAQGTEAGGHTGRVGTLALVPQVVDAVSPVPVLAAGGIADGRGLAAALTLGAEGVWVGTAFIATEESDDYQFNKEKIVSADEEGTQITKIFTGKTMRGIKNELMRRWDEAGLQTLPMPLQSLLMADLVCGLIEEERTDYISPPGGQAAGLVKEIRPARKVLEDIVKGAINIMTVDIPNRVEASEK
ncbi:MAG: nitronate monooxygenase [Deltaproteobacteria bacterium]|uniref:Nitronate monooxygenase n=1 Tax=Candidatus Zymogenus saltonus TaxID=2844893 RepID=A0A9D8KG76_9DELT|nr:nitronate monooxygenase [Candidatus Zymogenus saltonus]